MVKFLVIVTIQQLIQTLIAALLALKVKLVKN